MGPLMGIACPQIVYPYLRGNVSDIITRAGFPPVLLAGSCHALAWQASLRGLTVTSS